jgi:hypothetical protein
VDGEAVGAAVYSAPTPLYPPTHTSAGAVHIRDRRNPRVQGQGRAASAEGRLVQAAHLPMKQHAATSVIVCSTGGRVACLRFPCWPSWSAARVEGQAPPAPRSTAKVVWSAEVGSPVFASATVCLRSQLVPSAESFVLIPCAGGRLLALGALTGELIWSFSPQGPLMSAALLVPPRQHHEQNKQDKQDDNSRIILGCHKGWVYCVEPKDGRACWQKLLVPHLNAPVAGLHPGRRHHASPRLRFLCYPMLETVFACELGDAEFVISCVSCDGAPYRLSQDRPATLRARRDVVSGRAAAAALWWRFRLQVARG